MVYRQSIYDLGVPAFQETLIFQMALLVCRQKQKPEPYRTIEANFPMAQPFPIGTFAHLQDIAAIFDDQRSNML